MQFEITIIGTEVKNVSSNIIADPSTTEIEKIAASLSLELVKSTWKKQNIPVDNEDSKSILESIGK